MFCDCAQWRPNATFATAKIRIVCIITIPNGTFYRTKQTKNTIIRYNTQDLMSDMVDKQEIRREVRRRIKELDPATKLRAAHRIFDRAEATKAFGSAACIALFAAMGDEVPTSEALLRWTKLGKRVVVPRVEGDIMRYYDYDPAAMQSGAYGIESPRGMWSVRPRPST